MKRADHTGGLGHKLRKALEGRRAQGLIQPRTTKDKTTTMMSRSRRAIFMELCKHPCLTSGDVARAVRTSRGNATWHLERLYRSGFLTKQRQGGRWFFFPKNLLSDGDVPVFSVMGNSLARKIYLKIRERSSISHGDLSKALAIQRQDLSWHIRKLIGVGLIEVLQDGRHRRYISTEKFDENAKSHSRRTGAFRGSLMKALKEDNTTPSIVRVLSGSILIRMRSDPKTSVIEIYTDPYGQVLGPNKK